jgi:hypothetical protein
LEYAEAHSVPQALVPESLGLESASMHCSLPLAQQVQNATSLSTRQCLALAPLAPRHAPTSRAKRRVSLRPVRRSPLSPSPASRYAGR